VEVMQPAIAVIKKDIIKARIDEIRPGGATNLWGGSEIGYNQVLSKYKPGFINRVLLISDGLVNQGITSSRAIKMNVQRFKDDNGITLSTFGVGLDYNEVLMTEMAEVGAGNYYFIDDPDKMAVMFDKELNGLLKVAAQNAEITIKLSRGLKVDNAYPLKYEERGNELVIKFRDLFSEETKSSLLRFHIDDTVRSGIKFISTLSYNDVATGQRKTLTNENILSPVRNLNTYLTYFNKTVLEQMVLFTANENMERAMLEVDKGNYEKALQTIDENNKYLKANAGYVNNYMPLQQMDSINSSYSAELSRARTIGKDSVRMIQKASRSQSYKIRNKKI
jgi:Ca-activated chloride channel family protein